jgi:hypothetical protein
MDEDEPTICCLCFKPLDESDAVETKGGFAHESCAERHYGPYDPNRDPGIPKY